MGGFLSVQSKEKRRRTNRLSKPPPNRATLASNSFRASRQTSGTSSPTECPACTAWQDPWTGTSISLKVPEPDGRQPGIFYHPSTIAANTAWDRNKKASKRYSPKIVFTSSTPNEFEYTHLGALKLGSLRVVNGSASPCPSDRTRLNRPNSPDPEPSSINTHDTKSEQPQHSSHKVPCYMDQKAQLASESADEQSHNAEIVRDSGHEVDLTSFDLSNIQDYASESAIEQSRKAEIVRDSALDKVDLTSFDLSNIQDYAPVPCNDTARAPKLQIPPSGVGNPDDHPASPFSFERSPATSTPYRLQGSETEDEGVSIADEGKWFVHQLERSFREHGHRELQHAHGTVDSGYSSAASVRSTRRSTDSRTSTHQPGVARRSTFNGNSKDHGFLDAGNSPELGFEPSVHRHSSLQGPWARPKVDSYGWPSHRWSMCHDFRPMPPKPRLRSSSFATPPEYRHTMPYSQYCHQLRSLDTASPGLSVVSAGAIPHQSPQWEHVGASLPPSEKSWKQPMTTVTEHDVQGSSSTMSAAWLPMPNIDALRMSVPESMEGLDTGRLVSGQLRGRARSRSIESQRKRLTRHAKHPDLYKAASPTIFR
ncbi:hypothetical protein AAWM_05177 [Aspergillus awamori]|uniref:Uncharacterized protein n=1 Tax=Aspergillus awamori TaxID=105351 RepID=A0A401KSL5_ASPAW|nr:hypothetical protein AAWM_05177 [Aspergillus awamori]